MIQEFNRRLATLEKYVTSLGNTHIEGFNRRTGGGGVSYVESERDNSFRWQSKTVVITQRPADGDLTLKVREARYANVPPKPCTGDGDSATCFYEWYGTEFDVFPPLGVKAVSFAGDENTTDVSTPPKLTTKFHRIHREGEVWVLEKAASGGSSISLCLIHGPFNGTSWGSSQYFRVVHVKPNGSAYVTAEKTVRAPGDTADPLGYSIIKCWPGTFENFWQYGQSTQGTAPNFSPTVTAVYFATMMIGGVEYIAPVVPISMFTPDATRQAGDC